MLETQVVIRAFSRACAKTGKRIAARMAMIAITTSNSMRVNPGFRVRRMEALLPSRASSQVYWMMMGVSWEVPAVDLVLTHSFRLPAGIPAPPRAEGGIADLAAVKQPVAAPCRSAE